MVLDGLFIVLVKYYSHLNGGSFRLLSLDLGQSSVHGMCAVPFSRRPT